MKKILTLIAILIITSTTIAQNYPIQSNINITPPYSVYLSDYAFISSNKLMVSLLLKAINLPSVEVSLRLTIKGNGIELRTKENIQSTVLP